MGLTFVRVASQAEPLKRYGISPKTRSRDGFAVKLQPSASCDMPDIADVLANSTLRGPQADTLILVDIPSTAPPQLQHRPLAYPPSLPLIFWKRMQSLRKTWPVMISHIRKKPQPFKSCSRLLTRVTGSSLAFSPQRTMLFFSCIAERARGIVGQLSDISSRARQLLS